MHRSASNVSMNSSRSMSRVPSFEDLPEVYQDGDVELSTVAIEHIPSVEVMSENTELQIIYRERKYAVEEELEHEEAKLSDQDHLMTTKDVAKKYDTNLNVIDPNSSQGLDAEEADARIERYGKNALTPPKKVSEWKKLLHEFTGIFAIMLELAGIGCFVNYVLRRAYANLFLGIVLWLVVIISASLNYYQTRKSSRVMGSFGTLVPQRTVVIRGGQLQSIQADMIVPGDIVRVKGGEKIPADMRIVSCSTMKVDNSSLTGESEALSRTVDTTEHSPFEAPNLLFMGTNCLEGEGLGIVVATGDQTVLGKTASLVSQAGTELTVLQKEIKQFVLRISFIGIAVGIIVFAVSMGTKVYWLDAIVFCVGSIVAIVPEGLQLTVTIALTLTASRMASMNVLVKKLSIVETLGCTSVICSDKTGTLTQNNMTVSYVVYNKLIHQTTNLIHTSNRVNEEDPNFVVLGKAALLCNRAFFDPSDETGKAVVGDASETALLRYGSSVFDVDSLRAEWPKVAEIPFNSINKWQLSIHRYNREAPKFSKMALKPPKAGDRKPSLLSLPVIPSSLLSPCHDQTVLLMKGAPERILARCTTAFVNNEIKPLDAELKEELEQIMAELGSLGMRILGFAQISLPVDRFPDNYEFNTAEHNFPTEELMFTGFISIYDPPRDQVDQAVKICQGAGIRVVMVTGDHPATAKAIAKQIGIIRNETPEELMMAEEEDENPEGGNREGASKQKMTPKDALRLAPAVVIAGHELEDLTDEDWDIITSKEEIVFARTSPEQKLQIVSQFQARGQIVAVTGDGVNDSPALKRADVGVAMGITGSAVAKEAADIILMDDNFVTIVKAVEEGRLIFDNLKKSIAYALSAKLPEVLPFLSFIILGLPLPLSTVLVLCIDIGTDLIPGISLAYEKPEVTLMTRRPRIPSKHKLVSKKLIFFSFVQIGILQAMSGFVSFFMTMHRAGYPASSLFFSRDTFFQEGAPDMLVGDKVFDYNHQLESLAEAQTSFFCSIIITQIADAIICKTRFLSFFQQRSRNILQMFGLILAILVAVGFSYIPGVHNVLGTAPLAGVDWALCLPFAAFIFIQDEVRKFFIRRYPRGKIAKYTYW
eukprot:TRINITY_DN3556_c0_g2_i2.p1 TRINITY_DN3556_c0_g2~~TRINITY_DN3556_c0_g2_i2.p1  ORF type:complete len:1104 (+),score=302.37 TRINITY_DN3556_c0_g2_i2:184-3495(+)